MDIEKIKERIAKLLAMAKDASSPNEAAIAAGRARKLMDQHQIEEYDLDKGIRDVFAQVAATHFSRGMPTYMQVLSVSVAKYNDCHARYETGRMARDQRDIDVPKWGKRITFIGYKTDAELAEQMYNRLLDAVSKLCREYMKGIGSRSTNVALSFKAGAVETIISNINAMVAERAKLYSSGPGTALMVIKRKAVDEHFGETKYATGKGKQNAEWTAMSAGRVAGAKVEITPLVD